MSDLNRPPIQDDDDDDIMHSAPWLWVDMKPSISTSIA